MKKIVFICLFTSSLLFAQNAHSSHHHSTKNTLSEAGNDAFGTIQEVIKRLESDPTTNWKQVNIETLRTHLVDMHDMTFNVTVLLQEPIPQGFKARIKPTTQRAHRALKRLFSAHPKMLKMETDWEMNAHHHEGIYTLKVTTPKSDEVDKLRGLGYIGVMAWGEHHQPHHWMMATGKNPH